MAVQNVGPCWAWRREPILQIGTSVVGLVTCIESLALSQFILRAVLMPAGVGYRTRSRGGRYRLQYPNPAGARLHVAYPQTCDSPFYTSHTWATIVTNLISRRQLSKFNHFLPSCYSLSSLDLGMSMNNTAKRLLEAGVDSGRDAPFAFPRKRNKGSADSTHCTGE